MGIFCKGKLDIHAIDAGDERKRQHDDRDNGKDAHDLVDAIARQRIGGFGEAVDDLVVFVGDVTQLEEVIGDIAEILLHIIVQDGVIDGFELLHNGDLLADDATQGDDIAAQQSDLLDDALGIGFEEGVFDGVDTAVHLAQDGKDVIHQLINQRVEGMTGTAPEQGLAVVFGGFTAFVHADEGFECSVVHSDHVVKADDNIDFVGARDLVAGIPIREVHDHEKVVVILIELGAFDWAAQVFQVERVDIGEALTQAFDVIGAGQDEVDPGDGVVADNSRGHGSIMARMGDGDNCQMAIAEEKGFSAIWPTGDAIGWSRPHPKPVPEASAQDRFCGGKGREKDGKRRG